nr:LysR family transcriptional regulator [Nitrosomonas nitrosa]
MNLQQLRYVKALVDEGSFVGAAACCSVTKPTLSSGIAQLEAELGHRLFRRSTRSVRLTPYGESLLPSMIEVLRSFDNLTALSKCAPVKTSGGIHVGLSPIVGIRRAEAMLSRFKAKHPETEIVYRECNFRDLCVLLQRRQLDIVISPYDMSVSLEPDCLVISLEKDPLVFIPKLKDRHLWEKTDNVTLSDIANETFVMVPDACGLTSCIKSMFDANNLVLRRHAGEAISYAGIQEWAHLGLGAGILPKSRFQNDGMINIPLVHNGHPLTIEYYALGRPTTMSSHLFSQLWDSLLEVKIILHQISRAAVVHDRQLRLI